MPTIDTTRCKGCGQCAEVCPAGAIKEDSARLMMDCPGEDIQ